mmetsp:Transcript_10165/g.33616  ORF Transcript_10165/g.33616 Transcript_10165/m.33616 type:complete len:219 (-) Transcript_10165:260-916(-)
MTARPQSNASRIGQRAVQKRGDEDRFAAHNPRRARRDPPPRHKGAHSLLNQTVRVDGPRLPSRGRPPPQETHDVGVDVWVRRERADYGLYGGGVPVEVGDRLGRRVAERVGVEQQSARHEGRRAAAQGGDAFDVFPAQRGARPQRAVDDLEIVNEQAGWPRANRPGFPGPRARRLSRRRARRGSRSWPASRGAARLRRLHNGTRRGRPAAPRGRRPRA